MDELAKQMSVLLHNCPADPDELSKWYELNRELKNRFDALAEKEFPQ